MAREPIRGNHVVEVRDDQGQITAARVDIRFCQMTIHPPIGKQRRYPTLELTALYADAGVTYTYSGVTYPSLVWTAELSGIRRRVEEAAGAPFNSVLLNRYRDGGDSMGFHADDEPELGTNPVVPSISLGAERRFVLRHNWTRERIEYDLKHGSLLVMAGTLQHFWQHALPKLTRPAGERINLTFRNLLTLPSDHEFYCR